MPKLPSKAFETLKAAAKDKAAGINTERLSHNDVKMAAKDAEKRFAALITASIGDVKHYLETLET